MTEKAVEEELGKLVKRPARTQAEKNVESWLLEWKRILKEVKDGKQF